MDDAGGIGRVASASQPKIVADSRITHDACQTIYFATNRSPHPELLFGSSRSHILHFGSCEVSLPPHGKRQHKPYDFLPRKLLDFVSRNVLDFVPRKLLRFVPNVGTRQKHVAIRTPKTLSEADFYNKASQDRAISSAIVFVHGFNVPFQAAIYRAAQMKVDLKFTGAMVVFSWPSMGRIEEYPVDEAAIGASRNFLDKLLCDLAAVFQDIHIVGHSMGARAIVKSLEYLSSLASPPLFTNVILAAADIDRDEFLQCAPR